VAVAGKSQFACVDGPEFDAHQVDFGLLRQRNAMYRAAELQSLQAFERHPEKDLELVRSQCQLAQANPEVATLAGGSSPLAGAERAQGL
jgi:hypothetical protein